MNVWVSREGFGIIFRFLVCNYGGVILFIEIANIGGGGGLRREVEENNFIWDISYLRCLGVV